jgi:hypothetical protein
VADDLVLRLDGVRKRYNVGLPSEIEVLHGLGYSSAEITALRNARVI